MKRTDWDSPNKLSIVVQGALFQGNLIETANHCRHWRELFPRSQIILVISVTDVVTGARHDGVYENLRLARSHRHDGHLQAALRIMVDSCDLITASEDALPLPPIKRDSPKLNNMNFQIAAARQGLALATGQFVLRIRGDMIFLTRDFLDQYTRSDGVPRGDAAAFSRRVMISWLFTLNPYGTERMPLHFSDWFHFGLLEDVRAIWQAPFVTLADSLFYRTQPHLEDSNAAERLFNIRLAVEQHLMYHCFKPHFPELVLERHNDRTSINLAMDILADNFVLCDMLRAHCIFEKYDAEFHDPSKREHCITAEGWRALGLDRGADRRTTLLRSESMPAGRDHAEPPPPPVHAIAPAPIPAPPAGPAEPEHREVATLHPGIRLDPAAGPYSYSYGVDRLRLRGGRVVDGTIVSTEADGVLFYGPYVRIPAGRYVASINLADSAGPGSVDAKVTLNCGEVLLARRKFVIGASRLPMLQIPFEVTGNDASELEVVCTMKGVNRLVVSGLTVTERTGADERNGGSPWDALRSVLQPRRV